MIDHVQQCTKMVSRSMSMQMMASMVDRHVDRTRYMVRSSDDRCRVRRSAETQMTSDSSVVSMSYACAYRSCRCCSLRCSCLSSSYLVSPLVSLKIVRWREGRQLPPGKEGSCLKTVPAYGFRSQAGFTLLAHPSQITENLLLCPPQPIADAIDRRCPKLSTRHRSGVFSANDAGTGLLRLLPAGPPSSRRSRMSPGVTGSKNPPDTEPGRAPAVN